VIDNPRLEKRLKFIFDISRYWSQTELGLPEKTVKPDANVGWFWYMAKGRDKETYYDDAFDWENAWLEPQR